MKPSDVVAAGRSGWRVILGSVVAGLAVAGWLAWSTTPLYSSSTRLFVAAANPTDTSAAYQGDLFTQQRMVSYAELTTGKQLAGRVVDDLGLDMTPDEVADTVSATPLSDTVILEVTVTDTSPERARDIAVSLGRQFTDWVTGLETPASTGASSVRVTTIQVPELNPDPVAPDVVRYLSLGGLLGLLLGGGFAIARSRLDPTVKTTSDIVELTAADLMGRVFEDPELADGHLVTNLGRRSPTIEAIRAIRTNLQFLDSNGPPQVITVAGAVDGEGTSTLAVNLAVVLARSGSRVLLIDADLRRPEAARRLGLSDECGLTDVLAGTATFDDAVQPWGDGGLDVLATGSMPVDPSELLGSDRARSLLQTVRTTYDCTIIDTPALLTATDAAVLGTLSDGCLLVTRFGRTRRAQLAEAVAALAWVDVRILGVVLNGVPQGAATGGLGNGHRPDPHREMTIPLRTRSNGYQPKHLHRGRGGLIPSPRPDTPSGQP